MQAHAVQYNVYTLWGGELGWFGASLDASNRKLPLGVVPQVKRMLDSAVLRLLEKSMMTFDFVAPHLSREFQKKILENEKTWDARALRGYQLPPPPEQPPPQQPPPQQPPQQPPEQLYDQAEAAARADRAIDDHTQELEESPEFTVARKTFCRSRQSELQGVLMDNVNTQPVDVCTDPWSAGVFKGRVGVRVEVAYYATRAVVPQHLFPNGVDVAALYENLSRHESNFYTTRFVPSSAVDLDDSVTIQKSRLFYSLPIQVKAKPMKGLPRTGESELLCYKFTTEGRAADDHSTLSFVSYSEPFLFKGKASAAQAHVENSLVSAEVMHGKRKQAALEGHVQRVKQLEAHPDKADLQKPVAILHDYQEALKVVQKDGMKLRLCSESLRDDDRLVVAAMEQNSLAWKYASLRLMQRDDLMDMRRDGTHPLPESAADALLRFGTATTVSTGKRC